MDVKDYCRSIEIELNAWKTKMYNMVRKVDKLRSADKNKVSAQIQDLHKHIEDIERLVNTLQSECPADFGPQKKNIEATQSDMKKKYEDAMAAVLQF
jgi:predicted  nucleic acid-binding Zn-ribbon protein